jgi:hypothetical protein
VSAGFPAKADKQSGINMVDLMMWLVIAALMMAAAIQGIGYYQQAAYLYQVKNDVMGGATKVLSLSGMEHNGNVDEEIVDKGLQITQTTEQVVLEADTDPTGKPIIRGTHPGIPGKEVIYFFYPYGKYQSGNTTIAEPGEFLPTAPPRGDVDGDGTPNSTDSDIDGDGTPNESDNTPNGAYSENITDDGRGDGTSAVTIGTITGDGSGSYVDTYDWGHGHEPPMSNTLPAGTLDFSGWGYNATNRSVIMYFSTNGKFTGVGGSWIYMVHADILCYDQPTKKYYKTSSRLESSLSGPYAGSNPGPHTGAVSVQCPSNAPSSALPAQVVVRTATDAEWAGYSLGRLGWVYSLPDFVESWAKTYPLPPAG